jgi:hypothetical protein
MLATSTRRKLLNTEHAGIGEVSCLVELCTTSAYLPSCFCSYDDASKLRCIDVHLGGLIGTSVWWGMGNIKIGNGQPCSFGHHLLLPILIARYNGIPKVEGIVQICCV